MFRTQLKHTHTHTKCVWMYLYTHIHTMNKIHYTQANECGLMILNFVDSNENWKWDFSSVQYSNIYIYRMDPIKWERTTFRFRLLRIFISILRFHFTLNREYERTFTTFSERLHWTIIFGIVSMLLIFMTFGRCSNFQHENCYTELLLIDRKFEKRKHSPKIYPSDVFCTLKSNGT